ncbi:MAG: tetratricopeptide repeat protein [Anaerotignum sp.]|nr:tetratricopeptide repeat protein [Anaerotignum sp.]
MKCPNCGHSFSEGSLCPDCGVDVYVFRKAGNASIRLYNDALHMAEEKNLSGAAVNLEQSLFFDKNNIQARNLLGLIYCEIGHIADALKHWIISTSIQPENNPASGYMDYLQKNGREMEKCNDAVRMYNQAIHYLKQSSDDLAIIQLKKSIHNNPDFLDAYNLMTLCCIEDNNTKRALHFNELVLKRDVSNPMALHYARILKHTPHPAQPKKTGKEKTPAIKKTDSNPPIPRYKRKEKKSGMLEKRDLIAFLLGIAAAALVILVLIVPALNEKTDLVIKDLRAQVDSYAGETNMKPEEVLAMREELTKLQQENKQLRSEETKQANLELLQTAVAQMSDQDYESCVATLSSIDTVGFSEEDMNKYNSVKTTAFPKAADSYYTKGKSEFLSNNFAEAKTYLETALNYTSTENFLDDTYFYLAKIAEQSDDTTAARTYYNKIIAEYPDSNQIANVKNALEQLEQASE